MLTLKEFKTLAAVQSKVHTVNIRDIKITITISPMLIMCKSSNAFRDLDRVLISNTNTYIEFARWIRNAVNANSSEIRILKDIHVTDHEVLSHLNALTVPTVVEETKVVRKPVIIAEDGIADDIELSVPRLSLNPLERTLHGENGSVFNRTTR